MLPAATELADGEFVANRSASVARATTSAAVAVLFAELGSAVVELTVAVSLMGVPCTVPATTFTTKVNAPAPGATLGFVQLMFPVPPTAGRVPQVHPAGGVIDTKVVFGGVTSVKLAPAAALGPLLVTTWV